jgi:hypothetical protein
MNVQLAILVIFAILLVLSIANVLPIAWTAVCIAYLATCQAMGVLMNIRKT